jgi:hypothetical protein
MPSLLPLSRNGLGAWLIPGLVAATIPTMIACGTGAALPPPSTPRAASEPRPEKPAPDAVWVQLEPEEPDQHWSLVAQNEKVLCALPCSRWLSADSGAFLEYERPGATSILVVGLPTDLGPAGGSVIAVARLENRSKRTGVRLILGGLGAAFLGIIVYGIFQGLVDTSGEASDVALGVGLGVGVPLLGAGIYFLTKSHPADVSLRAASLSSSPTIALGPGFIEATTAGADGFHVILTPLGALGTF